MYKAYVDVGCRPNPGKGAYGFLIYDEKGNEIIRKNGSAGEHVTNNIAEYKAIIQALKAAISTKIKKLVIFSDSQLMVKQLNGDYQVRSPELKLLYDEVTTLKDKFEIVVFVHIKRNQNKLADAMTNQYYDKVSSGQL